MKKIISGYQKFFEQYFQNQSLYQKLFKRQSPKAMFIACCDSRVDPALLVSAQPGDIFVERNVANVVPHHTDGPNSILIALEVALCTFKVKDIIVLGHQRCAGVQLLACKTLHSFGAVPVEYIKRERLLQEKMSVAYDQNSAEIYEKQNIIFSCQNLMSHDIVAQAVALKKVAIHGWYFSLKTGKFETLCLKCFSFTDLMVACCGQRVI